MRQVAEVASLREDGHFFGRKRRQSPPSRTSASIPSTSTLRKSIAAGACCSHSVRKVVAGTSISSELLPNCVSAVEDFRKEYGVTETIETIDWTGVYWRKRDARS